MPASCRHPSTFLGLTPAKVPLGRRGLFGATATSSLWRETSPRSTQVANWYAIVFPEAGRSRWQRTAHLALAEGALRNFCRLQDRFKKSLSMSGEVGSLAGGKGVSHERSRPADLACLCSRQAGSYPSHYCGCFSRRALLAYGHGCRGAVTR